MALETGAKLGPYEVLSPLGAGGMGEVYRARDERLGREVAIKVLPEAFARDAERLARLKREAQVLASLNHPNIAAIYGLEEFQGTRFLVLELVPGETLAERLKRGPLPCGEALRVAAQIAEALEAAHERGLVHRDLKPGNVKVTPDDKVKTLDFGLAKALGTEESEFALSDSPTLTAAATRQGVLLGTAAYMSPEQARGKAVDRRADIWAFGCVLYEALTAQQAFSGETVSDTLAGVLRAEVDWQALPRDTPAPIQRLLKRCLERDVRKRLQAIGEARITIEETLSGADTRPPLSPLLSEEGNREARGGAPWRRALPWALTAFVPAVAAIIFAVAYLRLARAPVRAVRVSVLPPEKASFETSFGGPAVISPDGIKLAFVARLAGGSVSLWVRPLDALTAQPLAGTEGASCPFWSPDSRFIGFFAGGKLKKIEASGGPPQTLCDAPAGRGGSWNRDGVIIFSPTAADAIYRVSAAGGPATPLTKLAAGQASQRWPDFLPDGRHFLFFNRTGSPETNGTYVSSLEGGPPKVIVRGDSNAIYAAPGHLLFVRERTLMAQPFDAGKLEVTGDPFPVAENVEVTTAVWRGAFSASGNGALIFHSSANSGGWQLASFDRSGKHTGSVGEPDPYIGPSLSPDGRRLAVTISDPQTGSTDIWVFELDRGVKTRLTFAPGINGNAVWSPDGSRVAFISTRKGAFHSYVKAANGTGVDEPLLETNADERVNSWSADGKYLAYMRQNAPEKKDVDVWILPLFGDRKPFAFLQSTFNEVAPRFSPDVKWLAYQSDESGKDQIYVVPFPTGSGKWQVSANGGIQPKWRRDGRELYYLAPDNTLMAVDFTERGGTPEIGNPHALFQAHPVAAPGYLYDVSADGKRFIFTNETSQGNPEPVTLVLNWTAGLKK